MKIKSIKIMLAGVLLIPMLALGSVLFTPTNAFATAVCDPSKPTLENGQGCGKPNGTASNLFGPTGIFTTVMNTILFAIGSIAVIMLIYGGVKYTISGGDEKAVTSAKNTILYAVIGIVVALLAFAIVNFVIGALLTASPPAGGTEVVDVCNNIEGLQEKIPDNMVSDGAGGCVASIDIPPGK